VLLGASASLSEATAVYLARLDSEALDINGLKPFDADTQQRVIF